MDTLSHICMGAALGQAVMGDRVGRKALFWGAVAGNMPDADVLFQNLLSPAAGVLFHRGISHSFLVFILLAPLLAWLAQKLNKNEQVQSYNRWLALVSVSWLAHLFTDAFNTYGTGYFEPFSNMRVAFDCVNVVDVCYTLPLLLAFISLFFIKSLQYRLRIVLVTLSFTLLYTGFTVYHKFQLERWFDQQMAAADLHPKRILSSPLPLSNFAWMFVAEFDDHFYMANYFCAGQSALNGIIIPKRPDLEKDLVDLPDFIRLQRFSKGYYTVRANATGGRTFCDLRYSSLAELQTAENTRFVFEFDITPSPQGFELSRATPTRHISGQSIANYVRKLIN